MSRRVRLPGAQELFRSTRPGADPLDGQVEDPESPPGPAPAPADEADEADEVPERRTGSGRVRHDEKMTVYISAEELMDLEHARLALRRQLGAAVDRGRFVREAVAIALADLDERGPESDLARRLSRS